MQRKPKSAATSPFLAAVKRKWNHKIYGEARRRYNGLPMEASIIDRMIAVNSYLNQFLNDDHKLPCTAEQFAAITDIVEAARCLD